jgi:predicted dehydrogenase
VLALCDIDPKRLHGASQQFSIPRAAVSFGELLAMPDLDIIDICTRSALHLEQSLAALTAGKQVVCEKPLVGSLADSDRLIATELSATGRLLPVFQYRFGNGLQKAKHIIASGIAGKPYPARWRPLRRGGPLITPCPGAGNAEQNSAAHNSGHQRDALNLYTH